LIIETTLESGVATILADNPPVNALSRAVRDGLAAALAAAAADPQVTAIVIACRGRTYFAGADITEFGKPPSGIDLGSLCDRIERSDKPVVAAIHGTALGGGLETALACHYRVAVPAAKLGLPEVKLGLLPGAGGTQRLPRAISKAKAMDMCLTARFMDADEAERAGLVSRVLPADKLLDEALSAAATIAEFSLPAVMMIKESVNRAYETTLAEGVHFERRLFHSLFATEDQKEGMAAFVEKRKPVFKNR